MPIAINGNGTITGVTVGGLPDGIVDTDMLAADSVTAPKIGSRTFTSYAIIADQKSSGTSGGALTAGDWRTHDLQTELSDLDGIVSIGSNQFTLQAGTYFITYRVIAYAVNSAVCKIYNITDSTDLANSFSQPVYARGSSGHTIPVIGSVRFTISGAKVFELRQRTNGTHGSAGFGVAAGFSVENYLIMEIFKEA